MLGKILHKTITLFITKKYLSIVWSSRTVWYTSALHELISRLPMWSVPSWIHGKSWSSRCRFGWGSTTSTEMLRYRRVCRRAQWWMCAWFTMSQHWCKLQQIHKLWTLIYLFTFLWVVILKEKEIYNMINVVYN